MKSIYIHRMSAINPQSGVKEVCRLPLEKRLRSIEPDYKLCIPDAGIRRRMSRIVKMGVAAALECLKNYDPCEIDAIITATGLGCLGDTEKFMNSVLDNNERLLNPTAFIQSTFNTIGAQIALLCQNHHYNMTYVHRGFSFESALLDAQMMLEEKEADRILVGGVDELTETQYRIMERMGYWKNRVAGEGAHFFILGGKTEDCLGKIGGTLMFRGPVTPSERDVRIREFLESRQIKAEEIDLVLCGDERVPDLFSGSVVLDFKQYGGEYHTASAFALWIGTRLLGGQGIWDIPATDVRRVLIYNNYREVNHTVILLEKEV